MINSRFLLSEKTSYRLSNIKGKTGLNTNTICRLAICTSLRKNSIPKFDIYDRNGREVILSEILGEFENIIISLVKQKSLLDNFDLDNCFNTYLIGHLNRGIDIISNRVKKIQDLKNLFE